ncbi:MAG: hypothetical protein QF368_02140, partial [SAR202 cluster bacterium]|nr:hypothetical protein [SAR202 cluster bacterium]
SSMKHPQNQYRYGLGIIVVSESYAPLINSKPPFTVVASQASHITQSCLSVSVDCIAHSLSDIFFQATEVSGSTTSPKNRHI